MLKALDAGLVAVLKGLIYLYRFTLSYFLGRSCRFAPTCSQFGLEALDRYGAWAGLWLTLARIMRCRPKGNSGYDPVPDQLPEQASWYQPWRYGRWR